MLLSVRGDVPAGRVVEEAAVAFEAGFSTLYSTVRLPARPGPAYLEPELAEEILADRGRAGHPLERRGAEAGCPRRPRDHPGRRGPGGGRCSVARRRRIRAPMAVRRRRGAGTGGRHRGGLRGTEHLAVRRGRGRFPTGGGARWLVLLLGVPWWVRRLQGCWCWSGSWFRARLAPLAMCGRNEARVVAGDGRGRAQIPASELHQVPTGLPSSKMSAHPSQLTAESKTASATKSGAPAGLA